MLSEHWKIRAYEGWFCTPTRTPTRTQKVLQLGFFGMIFRLQWKPASLEKQDFIDMCKRN